MNNLVQTYRSSRFAKNLKSMLAIAAIASLSQPAIAQNNGGFNNGGFLNDWMSQAIPQLPNSNSFQSGSYTIGPQTANTNAFSTTNSSNSYNNYSGGNVRTWKLGVFVINTDVGALIDQVQPNSPAARAGLKSQDLIVAVNGQQVGQVLGRLNDVGDQVSRSAVNGRVTALVADGRTGALSNIMVNLESASNQIQGVVRLSERVTLPSAYMTVQLKNLDRPFHEVYGGTLSQQISGSGPFSFQINLDPSTVMVGDRYRLEATIDDRNGKTLYASNSAATINPLSVNAPVVLDLANYQQLIANNQNNNGQVIQAGYPNAVDLDQLYQQVLGRLPSDFERYSWEKFLKEGNSTNDLKTRLLSSSNFYDRSNNNAQQFVSNLYQVINGRAPSQADLQLWYNRLVQSGSREQIVREMLSNKQSFPR